jgi:hypothetical protein
MDTTNEPVAWLLQTKTAHQFTFKEPTTAPQGVFPIPLYTHPSEHDLGIAEAIGFDKGYKAATAKTLTDEEILGVLNKIADNNEYVYSLYKDFSEIEFSKLGIFEFARAILRKAQEK